MEIKMAKTTKYKHQHFTVLNSPDDSIVVELSVKSHYHLEQIMQIMQICRF